MDVLDVFLRLAAIIALSVLIVFGGVMVYVVILAILNEQKRK